jgi:hypothetical protein
MAAGREQLVETALATAWADGKAVTMELALVEAFAAEKCG